MATPPDSPIEEGYFDIGTTRVFKHPTVALEDLCKQTKFSRHEIRVMYRGFKQVEEMIKESKNVISLTFDKEEEDDDDDDDDDENFALARQAVFTSFKFNLSAGSSRAVAHDAHRFLRH
ncbi:hypothetical protein RUM44_001049 [Polyplax serrata]|uniref:Uncharacterized protein n=1 Tax=Polyplax serrata TaxID=468196 RepID=A0ABR1B6L8_POLSC